MPDPSTPISPEPDLSAALEDAEGQALVEDILARKKLRNARERFFQQVVFGDVRTDGHGNVIPRELPDYWSSVKEAWDTHVEGKLTYTRSLNQPAMIGIDPAGGPESLVVWMDEYTRFFREQYQDPHLVVREVVEEWTLTPKQPEIPEVSSVRWSCKAPTGPVYSVGTYGWAMEQAESMQSPHVVEYNRKLALEYRGKVSRLSEFLGGKPGDYNHPEVPESSRRG